MGFGKSLEIQASLVFSNVLWTISREQEILEILCDGLRAWSFAQSWLGPVLRSLVVRWWFGPQTW